MFAAFVPVIDSNAVAKSALAGFLNARICMQENVETRIVLATTLATIFLIYRFYNAERVAQN
jgi:hypothetical protein